MHNMLAVRTKPLCRDFSSRVRTTFYDEYRKEDHAKKVARNADLLGTYYSMEEAARVTLKEYHAEPAELHGLAAELGLEPEFDIPFLELVELLTPHLAGMTLGELPVLIEESKRKSAAEAALDEYRHRRARSELRIAS